MTGIGHSNQLELRHLPPQRPTINMQMATAYLLLSSVEVVASEGAADDVGDDDGGGGDLVLLFPAPLSFSLSILEIINSPKPLLSKGMPTT